MGGALTRITLALDRWYAIQTKRFQERLAEACLRQRGIDVYLPLIRQWPPPAVGSAVSPMFPGYLFTRFSQHEEYGEVNRSPGVKRFVTFGGELGTVSAQVIEMLRARHDEKGIVKVDCDLTQTEPNARPISVEVTSGPLRGLQALVHTQMSASDRVRILVSLLGRDVSVDVRESSLRRL